MSNAKRRQEATIEKLQEEKENLLLVVEDEQKNKDLYIEETSVYEERVQLRIDGTKKGKLTPEFEHEKNPRYWELYSKEIEYQFKEVQNKHKGTIEMFDFQIDKAIERIAEIDNEIESQGEKE